MKSIFLIFLGTILFTTFYSAFGQVQNPNIRIDDSSFFRESMQTGETTTPVGHLAAIIIEGLGTILIIVFIVIYAVKKRMSKEPK